MKNFWWISHIWEFVVQHWDAQSSELDWIQKAWKRQEIYRAASSRRFRLPVNSLYGVESACLERKFAFCTGNEWCKGMDRRFQLKMLCKSIDVPDFNHPIISAFKIYSHIWRYVAIICNSESVAQLVGKSSRSAWGPIGRISWSLTVRSSKAVEGLALAQRIYSCELRRRLTTPLSHGFRKASRIKDIQTWRNGATPRIMHTRFHILINAPIRSGQEAPYVGVWLELEGFEKENTL